MSIVTQNSVLGRIKKPTGESPKQVPERLHKVVVLIFYVMILMMVLESEKIKKIPILFYQFFQGLTL